MNTKFRIALVWGVICFLLLYRTLLAEVILSWQVLQEYDIPNWQLFTSYASNLLPSLIPLVCFLWLTQNNHFSKIISFTLPLAAWLIGRFIINAILWLITLEISYPPLFSVGFQHIYTYQLVQMYWSLNTLTSVMIILICGYAFWRERTTL